MARQIKPTPVLKGEDAVNFIYKKNSAKRPVKKNWNE